MDYQKYSLLNQIKIDEGIPIASLEDIAAMKINAINNRGSKKDFWDLYFLLNIFDLKEIIEFSIKKYPAISVWSVLKSLNWFEGADKQVDPMKIISVDWREIKRKISKEVAAF